jgi:dihydrofolate synthase/folylpolyglutamate synthase
MSAETPIPSLDSLLIWLDSHINYERTGMGVGGGAEHDPEHRLQLLRAFLDIMDNPQSLFPSLHVTGTNGKTSTTRMLTSLLMAQGVRAGTYTSPHLERLNERICVNGEPIADDELTELLYALRLLEPMAGEEHLSYFELMTAAALRHFADAPVEAAVVEVGVG